MFIFLNRFDHHFHIFSITFTAFISHIYIKVNRPLLYFKFNIPQPLLLSWHFIFSKCQAVHFHRRRWPKESEPGQFLSEVIMWVYVSFSFILPQTWKKQPCLYSSSSNFNSILSLSLYSIAVSSNGTSCSVPLYLSPWQMCCPKCTWSTDSRSSLSQP